LKVSFLALGSDSVTKREVKHHHWPTPRLRFVPQKKNRPLMRGAFLLDLSLIGGRLHH